jgi:arginine/lysine/ornithine decarboxylase
MPGHKGVLPPPFDGIAPLDVTELPGTGDLYHERDGVIRRSERAMAALYGAADCFYLTGGATQGIFAMLSSVTRPGDTVRVDRACHRSVYNALILLDLRPVWFTRSREETCGAGRTRQPVIYTSPDYFGVIAPPPQTDGPVLCDAAHGAHLPFCTDGYAPPGNLWVVSAHKTLGALGQTACLLSDGNVGAELLRERTAIFGTASPSFVLLASLDAARAELERNGRTAWGRVAAFTRSLAEKDGRVLKTADPAKLVVFTGNGTGDAERLEHEFGVVCEMAGADFFVLMLSPHNTDGDLTRLEKALEAIPERDHARERPGEAGGVPFGLAEAVMTPREAFFAERERIALSGADGRVAACVFAPFAPGVPVFAPGERIDKKALEILAGMCYTEDTPIWVVR